MEFKLALHPDVDSCVSKKFSRADTVGEFLTLHEIQNDAMI